MARPTRSTSVHEIRVRLRDHRNSTTPMRISRAMQFGVREVRRLPLGEVLPREFTFSTAL